MSVGSIQAGGDFRVGDVLARAWNVFIGNFPFFFGITLLVYVVIGIVVGLVMVPFIIAIGLSIATFDIADVRPETWVLLAIGVVVVVVLFFMLNQIGQAVLLLGAFQRMRGQPLRVGEALRRAFARFFPLLGLGLLLSLALMLGFLLLVVPAVILFCMWWVVVPACVVEGRGPIESMSRSAALTKGYRWKIFGLAVVVFFMNVIGNQAFALLFGLAGEAASAFGSMLWYVVWTALWNCVLIMTYHDLRVAKEGIDIEQIAAIFD